MDKVFCSSVEIIHDIVKFSIYIKNNLYFKTFSEVQFFFSRSYPSLVGRFLSADYTIEVKVS